MMNLFDSEHAASLILRSREECFTLREMPPSFCVNLIFLLKQYCKSCCPSLVLLLKLM